MRSTIKISSNTAINNILDNYSRVLKIQNQMSKGRRVVNPSDDPLAANAGMRLDSLISRISQYNRNIASGDATLAISDSALGDVTDLLNEAKNLTIGAASDTTTQEMRRANAVEVNNLFKEMVAIGNYQNGDRYVFAGTETTRAPLEMIASRYAYYRGNDKELQVQVDASTYMKSNITGSEVFGTMESVLTSGDFSPDVNLGVNTSTRLEHLNQGKGVPDGSINILYSAFPATGLNIDLTGADTLEDVRDIIEMETTNASAALNPAGPLGPDVIDRYIRVEINEEHNGIMLTEVDLGTSGGTVAGTVIPGFEVREVGGNTVARDLGVVGTSTAGVLIGSDLDALLDDRTLLADIKGYDDAVYTITNGALPGNIIVRELNDTNNSLSNWQPAGLSEGVNTGVDGELYARISYPAAGDYRIDLYKVPVNQALGSDLVATGRTTANGTVTLLEANNSGISGTVGLNYAGAVGTTLDIDVEVLFDETFRGTVNVPAFVESGDTNNLTDGWHIRGLELGVTTDANGDVFAQVQDLGAGVREVRLYNDAPGGTLIASGRLNTLSSGTVELQGVAGFTQVKGSVHLEWPVAPAPLPGAGPHDITVNATFATVGDFINSVETSNTYTSARVNENGRGFDIISHLAGAHLVVSESNSGIPQMDDTLNQLTQLNLDGITRGENTDAYGNLYAEVFNAGVGNPVEVRIYSDRNMSNMVASGSIALPGVGLVTLSEVNDSGLTGSVQLTFAGNDNSITIADGGYRVGGDVNGQISQLDIQGVIPGQNADFGGQLHIVAQNNAGNVDVQVYKDAAHTVLVATGGPVAGPAAFVPLVQVAGSGISGSLYMDYAVGVSDQNVVVSPGATRLTGHVREDNIFATFNDVIDALHANDAGALHDLIGNFKGDLDRLLLGRADVGARQQRMQLLQNRHEEEKLNFGKIRADRIDLDYAEAVVRFQAEQNIFEASLRTTAQIIPLSLVDFI